MLFDWAGFDGVEVVEGKLSGVPVCRRSRLPAFPSAGVPV
jgi:hypothetical protein